MEEVFYIKGEFSSKQAILDFEKMFENIAEDKDSIQVIEEENAIILKVVANKEEDFEIPFVGKVRITRRDVKRVLRSIPYPTKFGITNAYLLDEK